MEQVLGDTITILFFLLLLCPITASTNIPIGDEKIPDSIISDFLMWAVFSRVILEMGMALFFVKMEKIWQDSDRRKN